MKKTKNGGNTMSISECMICEKSCNDVHQEAYLPTVSISSEHVKVIMISEDIKNAFEYAEVLGV